MFASRYFNPRYWASRYWPKVGGIPVDTPDRRFSVEGKIDAGALNLFSFIDSSAQSVVGQIFDKHSVTGKIDDSSVNVDGPIDSSAESVTGKI